MYLPCNLDIRPCCQCGQQVELLKNKSECAPPDCRPLAVIHCRDMLSINCDRSTCRLSHRSKNVHECRLPASGRSHDCDKFTTIDFQIHAPQGFDVDLAQPVGFAEIERFQQSCHIRDTARARLKW